MALPLVLYLSVVSFLALVVQTVAFDNTRFDNVGIPDQMFFLALMVLLRLQSTGVKCVHSISLTVYHLRIYRTLVQNSYGATHSDVANFQKRLSFYCADNAIDAFPVAFVTTFFGTGGLPVMNLANICNNVDNATFPGSQLPNCTVLASDITTCQAKGKIVTISLGGAGGAVGFSSDAQASSFADQVRAVQRVGCVGCASCSEYCL